MDWGETMNVSDDNLGGNESGISFGEKEEKKKERKKERKESKEKNPACFCCMHHCRDQLTHVITREPAIEGSECALNGFHCSVETCAERGELR